MHTGEKIPNFWEENPLKNKNLHRSYWRSLWWQPLVVPCVLRLSLCSSVGKNKTWSKYSKPSEHNAFTAKWKTKEKQYLQHSHCKYQGCDITKQNLLKVTQKWISCEIWELREQCYYSPIWSNLQRILLQTHIMEKERGRAKISRRETSESTTGINKHNRNENE